MGSVLGSTSQGFQASDDDLACYFGEQPSVDLEKWTNNQDADLPPGQTILAGDPVTWTYHLHNTGNVPLLNLRITDDMGTSQNAGDDTLICVIGSLSVEQTQTCTRQSSAAAGQYGNIGSVEGRSISGLVIVRDQDSSHYFGGLPSITLKKTILGMDADIPPGPFLPVGQNIDWNFEVTNSGNVSLSNVSVIDDQGTPQNTTDDELVCQGITLPPGAVHGCTSNDISKAGQYGNIAKAAGTPVVGPDIFDIDMGHYFGAIPSLVLEKTTNGQSAENPPGQFIYSSHAVTWTYTVTNTGNVTLSNILIKDDNGTPLISSDDKQICIIPLLTPSASESCSSTGTAQSGQYTNVGAALATPPGGLAPVSATDLSNYFGAQPKIELVKMINGEDANNPPGPSILVGEPITWTYVITNTGNVTLTMVTLSDDQLALLTCPKSVLYAGESMRCTANGTAERGQQTNIGTVQATPPKGLNLVSDSDPSNYLGYLIEPAIDLRKTTNGADADGIPGPYALEGSEVTWNFYATNIGNIELSNLSILDDNGSPSDTHDDIEVCSFPSLAVREVHHCSHTGPAQTGQYSNHAIVTAFAPGDVQISDGDSSHYFGARPEIQLDVKLNGIDAPAAPGPYLTSGSTLHWSYEISNTGNVILSNVNVRDDSGTSEDPSDDVLVCIIGQLAPNTSDTCTLDGAVKDGQHSHQAAAVGTPPGELTDVSSSDIIYYYGAQPSILLIMAVNNQVSVSPPGPYFVLPQDVVWSYLVYNDGNVTLSDITIEDNRGTPTDPTDDFEVCTIASLEPGFSHTCTFNETGKSGQQSITSKASATPPSGLDTIVESDTSHYFGAVPAMEITKATNGKYSPSPPGMPIILGETITWTYQISNTGNVELVDVKVVDDNGTPGNTGDDIEVCSFENLEMGVNQTCTSVGIAEGGQYINHASLTSWFQGQLSDSDTSCYLGIPPDGIIFLPIVFQ